MEVAKREHVLRGGNRTVRSTIIGLVPKHEKKVMGKTLFTDNIVAY